MDTPTVEVHATSKGFSVILTSFSIVLISFVCQILTNRIISTHIDVADFGDYTAIVNGMSLFATVTLLGSDMALMNFMSEYLTLKVWNKAKGYLIFFLGIFLWLIVAITVISFISILLNHLDKELYFEQFISSHVFIKYLWLSPTILLAFFLGKLLRTIKHQILSQILANVLFRSTQIAILITFIGIGIELTLNNTVMVFIISYATALLSIIIALKYLLPKEISTAIVDTSDKFLWLKVATEVFIANVFFTRINTITVILDRIFDPNPNNAGYLAVMTLVANCVWLPASVVQIMYGTELRPNIKLKQYDAIQQIANHSFIFLASTSFIFCCIFLIFHHEMLGYFGFKYTHLYHPTLALIIFNLFAILSSPMMNVMIFGGKQHLLSLATLYSIIIFIPISILLIYHFGMWGSIAFVGSANAVCTILPTWFVNKNIGVTIFRFGARARKL